MQPNSGKQQENPTQKTTIQAPSKPFLTGAKNSDQNYLISLQFR